MPDHNIKVIDLGLTVPQAIDHGLETEHFTRKVALPSRPGPRRGRGRMVHRRADSDAGNGQDALRLHPLRAERLLQRRAGRVHRGRSGTARRHREARAPTGRGGRARADGSRRGAHRDGLGRDRGHGRHRRRGGRSDRRPPEPGRGGRGAHPRHLHRRADPVMAVVGATARERATSTPPTASPTLSAHNSQSNWPRRRTTRSSTFTGLASVFDNLDHDGDIVRRGAFSKSLDSGTRRYRWSGCTRLMTHAAMSVMSSRPPRPTTVWRSRAGLISTPSSASRPTETPRAAECQV